MKMEFRRRRREVRRFCRVGVDPRQLTNLGKSEKIAYDRLAAAVFVGAIGMQPVAAAPGFQIDQRHGQIIAAEKPGEGAFAMAFHSASPSARHAARQAEIVAVASRGC